MQDERYLNNALQSQIVQQPKKVKSQEGDDYTITNLIQDQLKKNQHEISIDIKIPIIKLELFGILQDSYPKIFDVLLKTITSKYINQESLYNQLKDKLGVYYQINNQAIDSNIIECKTEEIN